MYNTNDIEEVLERDKPLLAVVSACLHLSPASPVLKILDDLFITAAEILSAGGHPFTSEH